MRRLALIVGAVAVAAYLAGTAVTGANTVPATKLGRQVTAINVDAKKPASCNGITVTNLVTGGGNGNDLLRGDAGTDVCIGGTGTDTFDVSCETQIQ